MPTSTATPAPNGSPVTFALPTVPLSAAEIGNSLRGQYLWVGAAPDPSAMPDTDVYYRDEISWKQIEPSPGSYNFTVIDQGLAAAQAHGGKFGFRVMAYCPGCSQGSNWAPAWIPTDPANVSMVQWNSSTFLSEWKALMAALGNKYGNDVRLGWLDIGGYGSWGEWHLYQQTGTPITQANMDTLITDVVNAFPNKTALAMTPNATFLADAMNISPHIGVRVDCLGANGLGGGLVDQVPAALSRWQTEPFVTEWCNGTLGGSNDEFATGNQQVAQYHISMLSSGNYPTRYTSMSSYDQQQFMNANKEAGYRYQLDTMTLPSSISRGTSFSVSTQWENVNVAPTYEPWTVQLLLRNSSGSIIYAGNSSLNLRTLLPTNGTPRTVADAFTLPASIVTGTYYAAVRVVDPSGYLAPMSLANQGRNADGSYALGSVTVT
jgi:hypothetical protein